MSQATLNTPVTSASANTSSSSSSAPDAPVSGRSAGTDNPTPINYANRRTTPARHGINFRLILFIAVVGVPLLCISWLMVRGLLNKGISWHGDYAEVDLKALGNFPFDQANGTRDNIPQRWRDLDGKKVELKGFMFSPQSAAGVGTQFQFVYNVNKCCFNGPPLVQERVYGHSRGEVPLLSVFDFAKVVGILHVRVIRDESGAVHSVFDLDVQHVEALEG